MTAGPVCLRSPRLLPSVGACFVLVGTSERLPTWTTGCTSIRIAVTLGYEYRLFVAVIA
jgi:hypothetical protein